MEQIVWMIKGHTDENHSSFIELLILDNKTKF